MKIFDFGFFLEGQLDLEGGLHTGWKQLASLARLILGLTKSQTSHPTSSLGSSPYGNPMERDALSGESPTLAIPTGKTSVSRAQESWVEKELCRRILWGSCSFSAFLHLSGFIWVMATETSSLKSSRISKKKKKSTANSAHEQPKGCDWKGSFSCSSKHPGFQKEWTHFSIFRFYCVHLTNVITCSL